MDSEPWPFIKVEVDELDNDTEDTGGGCVYDYQKGRMQGHEEREIWQEG